MNRCGKRGEFRSRCCAAACCSDAKYAHQRQPNQQQIQHRYNMMSHRSRRTSWRNDETMWSTLDGLWYTELAPPRGCFCGWCPCLWSLYLMAQLAKCAHECRPSECVSCGMRCDDPTDFAPWLCGVSGDHYVDTGCVICDIKRLECGSICGRVADISSIQFLVWIRVNWNIGRESFRTSTLRIVSI